MLKIALLLSLPIYVSASTGIWVKTDGTAIEAPCPGREKYGEQTRLPSGCTVEIPGMWLSVKQYTDLKVQLAEQQSLAKAQQEVLNDVKQSLANAQSDLLLCRAIPTCPPCEDHTTRASIGGAIIGTALASGGCLVWTLSH